MSLYGLDETSPKFRLEVRDIFLSLGLQTMIGDEVLYCLNKKRAL